MSRALLSVRWQSDQFLMLVVISTWTREDQQAGRLLEHKPTLVLWDHLWPMTMGGQRIFRIPNPKISWRFNQINKRTQISSKKCAFCPKYIYLHLKMLQASGLDWSSPERLRGFRPWSRLPLLQVRPHPLPLQRAGCLQGRGGGAGPWSLHARVWGERAGGELVGSCLGKSWRFWGCQGHLCKVGKGRGQKKSIFFSKKS